MSRDHPPEDKPRVRVAVFGATGHTGHFVVTELLQRNFGVIAIGRNQEKLAQLADGSPHVEVRLAATENPQSLDHALSGAAAVINCAGPFLDTAESVISAALRTRIHYLDVTAEQASAQRTFEQFSGPAQEQGVSIVPAMGFYGGLGDLLVSAATKGWASIDELRIMTTLDRWHPTEGTRRTGERNTAQRLIVAGGELQLLSNPAPTASWDFPEPFGPQDLVAVPLTETILISRHLKVNHLLHFLNRASLTDLNDSATPPPQAVDERGRSAQLFLMEVVAQHGREERRARVRGRDIYAVSAPLVVEAVQRLLSGPNQRTGVFAPGDLFDAAQFLESLSPHHLLYEAAL